MSLDDSCGCWGDIGCSVDYFFPTVDMDVVERELGEFMKSSKRLGRNIRYRKRVESLRENHPYICRVLNAFGFYRLYEGPRVEENS